MEALHTRPLPLPLPLPRRVWWPWDVPATRVGFWRTLMVGNGAAIGAGAGTLHLAASGECRVWLDGQEIVVPASPMPLWFAVRRVSVPLVAGAHSLAIEATPGVHRCPFLLACLDWQEGNETRRIATDADWRMIAEPSEGWQDAVDGTSGRPVWAFEGVWAEPWGMPANAPDDWCRLSTGWQEITETRPARLVRVHEGLTAGGASLRALAGGAFAFVPPRPFPAAPPTIAPEPPGTLWHQTRQNINAVVNSWLELYEARCPHIVLDTGAETFARVRVQLRSGGPAILAITTGESLPEVDRYARRVTDIVSLTDSETYATYPHGFRYVKVMVLGAADNTGVVVEPVTVQHIRYPVTRVGSFACSDPALDTIWALAAETVHICMQNEVWDGPKRDQLPWMGDLYVENLAAFHAFGDARLTGRSLAVLAEIGPAPSPPVERQANPGLVASWKAPGGDMNTIPSYTMWWVVGLADFLMYTTDTATITALVDALIATLDHIATHVSADDGLWHHDIGWDYVDWAPIPPAERATFCHLLATQVMTLGVHLLATVARDGTRYVDLAAQMREAARRVWWQDGAGQFGNSHHVNAMAIRSGVLSDDEAATLFARTLAPDPPVLMTYWHRYADLDAAARVGEIDWGLAYLRRHWGQAVQAGMTTLWEAFDPAWLGEDPHAVSMIGDEYAQYGGYRTSLCHGWSAGPAVWLHTAILGVRPAAPGFAAFTFTPHLGDLAWAHGTIPTPHGPITVSLTAGSGIGDTKPIATLTVPPDIAATIPDAVRAAWEITGTHTSSGDS